MLEKLKQINTNEILSYKFYSSTRELSDVDLSALSFNNNLFFRHDYLTVLEENLSDEIKFNYIVFFYKETPVAFAVTQLIEFDSNQQKFQDIPCSISNSVKNKILKNLEFKLLICGNLFTCGEHGFIFNKEKITAKTAYESLAVALRELRKKDPSDKPSFILLKEFWPDSATDAKNVIKQKFREFEIDVNMVLPINSGWKNFDDYLQSMRTKFRTRAKSVLKKSAPLEICDFNFSEIIQYKSVIDTLYSSVIDNAQFKMGKLNAETFSSLKKILEEEFIFKAYFLEEQLVGFTTAFITEKTIEANHIGINYNFNKEYNIYQRMLYNYVELAIKRNKNELHLGRTAEIIKSTVGAKPVSMKLYARHGNSISNKLLKPLVELISPSDFEIRNPFKTETASSWIH